jgi:hypothetical protein
MPQFQPLVGKVSSQNTQNISKLVYCVKPYDVPTNPTNENKVYLDLAYRYVRAVPEIKPQDPPLNNF